MFSYMFLILLLSLFICKQECAVSRPPVQQKQAKENAFELVLKKYIKPLRKLTDELPNHAIEMQIEFFDQTQKPSTLLPAFKLLRHAIRASDNTSHSVTPKPATSSTPELTTTTTQRPTTVAVSTTAIVTTTTVLTSSPSKKPVYMEDLNKALNDLEKRLQTTSSTASTASTAKVKVAKKLSKLRKSGKVKNIDDILELLKKAVQIERHIPQPTDENLDWVQIKIPKDIT